MEAPDGGTSASLHKNSPVFPHNTGKELFSQKKSIEMSNSLVPFGTFTPASFYPVFIFRDDLFGKQEELNAWSQWCVRSIPRSPLRKARAQSRHWICLPFGYKSKSRCTAWRRPTRHLWTGVLLLLSPSLPQNSVFDVQPVWWRLTGSLWGWANWSANFLSFWVIDNRSIIKHEADLLYRHNSLREGCVSQQSDCCRKTLQQRLCYI